MKIFILILSSILLFGCHSDNQKPQNEGAKTPKVAAENASPFGLLLGSTTYQETKAKLQGMKDVSLNPREDAFFGSVDESVLVQYATGKTIKASGDGLGIDRLEVAVFVFDATDKLSSVILKQHNFLVNQFERN